jgi:glutamate synthase (NADPH/NADH) small chain
MTLGAPDATGRRRPVPCRARKRDVPADMVVAALGFEPEAFPETWWALRIWR